MRVHVHCARLPWSTGDVGQLIAMGCHWLSTACPCRSHLFVFLKNRVCPRIPRASIKPWGVIDGGGISNFQRDNRSCFMKINKKQAVLLCTPPTAST